MSYWDWLPLELQVYVLRLRDSRALIDRRESQGSRDLCVEIEQCGELREKWGLGFVHLCRCKIVGNGRHKMEFWDQIPTNAAKIRGCHVTHIRLCHWSIQKILHADWSACQIITYYYLFTLG